VQRRALDAELGRGGLAVDLEAADVDAVAGDLAALRELADALPAEVIVHEHRIRPVPDILRRCRAVSALRAVGATELIAVVPRHLVKVRQAVHVAASVVVIGDIDGTGAIERQRRRFETVGIRRIGVLATSCA
jgi:hypothetical protein